MALRSKVFLSISRDICRGVGPFAKRTGELSVVEFGLSDCRLAIFSINLYSKFRLAMVSCAIPDRTRSRLVLFISAAIFILAKIPFDPQTLLVVL